MAILEKVNKVYIKIEERIVNVMFRKQEYSTISLYNMECSFEGGRLYGILCDHNESGWGISCLLSGRLKLNDEIVLINNKRYIKNDRIKEGWYVGEGLYKKQCCLFEKTIKQQIAFALKHSQLNMTVDDIINKFELSQHRINNKFSHMSWESWRASAAIGYAYGKCIFCFPWLDTAYLKDVIFSTGFLFYIKILRDAGTIIILPSSDEFILRKISDEIIKINDPSFHEYKYIEKYIQEQKKF